MCQAVCLTITATPRVSGVCCRLLQLLLLVVVVVVVVVLCMYMLSFLVVCCAGLATHSDKPGHGS